VVTGMVLSSSTRQRGRPSSMAVRGGKASTFLDPFVQHDRLGSSMAMRIAGLCCTLSTCEG
jgi:hypothetical protein